jgi:hypothetical protein
MEQTLEAERRELQELRCQLESDKAEFERKVQREKMRLENENQLIEMKLRILEKELTQLAADKEKFEQQRAFYERVNAFESNQTQQEQFQEGKIVRGDKFFIGVKNKTSLKKRYKDLLKIYHPDNAAGDKSTVQEITDEYQKLYTAMHA